MSTIQWFPGHMAKARREITESLKKVDAVLELVDARLPVSSANPMLREVIGSKPKTVVLTRADLADPEATEIWKRYFKSEGSTVVAVDARDGNGVQKIIPALDEAAKGKRERDAKRGIRPRALRTMVIGIPNVGKSSLINRLAGRAATKTGDRPGITKVQQWIRLGKIELLDTPGVLWPKFENEQSAYNLAMSGAIKSGVLDTTEVAAYFLAFSSNRYPGRVAERFGISDYAEVAWASIQETWPLVEPVLEEIADRRGLRAAGSRPDVERAADLVLRELQTGKLGRMTFELPSDFEEENSLEDES